MKGRDVPMKGMAERYADLSPSQRTALGHQLATAADTLSGEPIAVVGMGCRFPGGAVGPNAYWRLLHQGRDAVADIPADRWDAAACYDPNPDMQGMSNSRWGAFLDDVAGFDAEHFGITPREATAMDPQQRLLLEVAVEAIEDAGRHQDELRGSRTGLFAGVYYHDYQLVGDPDVVDAYSATGNAHSITAGRVSYRLDLRGPSLAVDTACSSSLVAIHLACQSLRMRESDLALAGGVNLILSSRTHQSLTRWGMMSPTGRCRSFDEGADGFVRGEGCGLVVLKRLTDAIRDADTVLAVVRGTAVNSDGRSQGLTAPNGAAQRRVIDSALSVGGVDPGQVGFIETHGTGTPIGDPIEFEQLADVYGRGAGRCALGAVKTNLGHLEAAAGVAGVIKAVLALRHGVVPPNLHFNRWNPGLHPDGLRFFVPSTPTPWPVPDGPRLAAVSSFGFGGTNAHLVLEQAPGAVGVRHREPRSWNHVRHWVTSLNSQQRPSEQVVPADWVYDVVWKPADLDPAGPGTDRWLVLAGTRSAAEPLVGGLTGLGLAADAGTAAGIDDLLADVDRVVYLAPQGPPESAATRAHLVAGELLAITQGLLRQSRRPRLHLVTRGAVSPRALDRPDPAQATLVGWARGLAVEHPDLWGGVLDVDPAGDGGDVDLAPGLADLLVSEAAGAEAEDVVAYRGGRRLVPRLAHLTLPATVPAVLAGPGTVLVVGANGAIGGRLVRKLAALGASHLTLVSRRGVVGPLLDTVRELAGRAVSVVDVVADAADATAMTELFTRFGDDLPELTGVVAAAFAGGAVPLDHLTQDDVAAMFRPKIDAASLLDRLSRAHPIRHFLLFSSTTGLLGSRQLAHYAAAGAFLDALAFARVADGLPVTVVDWGIWASRLAATDPRAQAAVLGSGLIPMDDDTAIRVLGPLLSDAAPPRAVVAAADWSLLASAYGSRHQLRLIEDLVAEQVGPAVGDRTNPLFGIPPAARADAVQTIVRGEAAAVMRIASAADLATDVGFFQLGMDSLMSVQLLRRLETVFGLDVPASTVFNHPTVDKLAAELLARLGWAVAADGSKGPANPAPPVDPAEPIAVVGIGLRFPGGATDPASFWELLDRGGSGIIEVPSERWNIDDYYNSDHTVPGTICGRSGGFLSGWKIDEFDADFFGISPREAEAMDPQQRLLLEVAVESLANAGVPVHGLNGTRTGVFVGLTTHDYLVAQSRVASTDDVDAYSTTGNAANFAAGRIAYHLGLQGPSLTVDTACSSSLTATHLALQALRTGDADVALAGGVNLMLTPDASISFSRWGMLSTSGVCRAFDEDADGFVRGEGAAMVVLKRLSDAQRAGDRVYAVLRGSSANQDGRSGGQTVPNGIAQQAVIREAIRRSGLGPDDIDYVEGHGAGTPLGDPIELDALASVFGSERARDNPLIVGSVKTNIGHLEASAGIAGLVKTVLAVHHGVIPAHLNLERLTSRIGAGASGLRVPAQRCPWPRSDRPARAGVSAFGASGTNVHLVVEQFRGGQPIGRRGVWLFSGQGSQWPAMGATLLRDEPAFARAVQELEPHFVAEVGLSLAEILTGAEPLSGIDVVQPALFAMQVGLAALWRSFGFEPDAVIGHSMGEVAAAVVAGALPLGDGMKIIARRSRLMRAIAGNGAMALLELGAAEAAELIQQWPGVEVAVHSSPRQTVVSGGRAEVEQLVTRQTELGQFARLVPVDVASHSAQVEPLLAELAELLADLDPREPQVRFLSTVTDAEPTFDAAYWVANLRRPVMFGAAVDAALRLGHSTFLEISPHPLLTNAVLETAGDRPVTITPSLTRDAPGFTPGLPMELPCPQWHRRRYWFRSTPHRAEGHPLLGSGLASPDGTWTFAAEIGTARLPWLADHAVHGRPVLPAAALVEVALAATVAAQAVTADQVQVNDLRLERLVPLDEHTRMTVVLKPAVGERAASVEMFTVGTTGSWTRHASAITTVSTDLVDAPLTPPEIEAGGSSVDVEQLYARLRAVGQEHGPAFRSVLRPRLFADGTVVADLRLPDSATTGRRGLHIHPVLLDGALQLLAASRPAGSADPADDVTLLPARIGSVELFGSVRAASRASARMEIAGDGKSLVASVMVADDAGRVILRLSGIEIVRLGSAAAPDRTPVFVTAWRPSASPAHSGTSSVADRLVLVTEDVGDPIPALLAEWFTVDQVPATDELALRAALRSPTKAVVLLAARGPAEQREVHGQKGSDGPGFARQADPADWRAEDTAMLAVQTAKVVIGAGLRDVPRLFLVTAGSAQVTGTDPIDLQHASWRGVARVLAYEHPELRTTQIDTDPEAVDVERLAAELVADGSDIDVAYRAGARLVARLAPETPTLRPAVRLVDLADAPIVVRCPDPTGPGSLRIELTDRAEIGPTELEIRVEAAGVNFSDVLKVHGGYPLPTGESTRIGGEFVGVVSALGDEVTDLAIGDRVMGFGTETFASYVRTSMELVTLVPPGLGVVDAATIPVAFGTAWHCLHHVARLRARDRLLVNAASGGVGLAAVAIARDVGAELFVTAGTHAKREYLRTLGIDHVYDSRDPACFEQIAADAGALDVVLNSSPGEALRRSLGLLAPGGHLVELGKADTYGNSHLDLGLMAKGCTLSTVDLDLALRTDPALGRRLLDEIRAELTAGRLAALPSTVFGVADVQQAVELIARAGHIGKVILTVPQAGQLSAVVVDGGVRADGAYVVTGGLSGIGLVSARWLADRGARRVVLNGRSAPNAATLAVIDHMRTAGTDVAIVLGDIGSADTARRAVLAAVADGLQLRGVIHSAGILDDRTLLRLSRESLDRVFGPKVAGARRLDEACIGHPLDFFVLYSSAASLLGAPGQAAYAAANAWLDAFAAHRRARGLTALAINWGPWGEVGQAVDFASRGFKVLSTAEGVAALGRVITTDLVQAGIFPLDPRRYLQSYPAVAGASYFAEVRDAAAAPAGRCSLDLASVPADQRRARLIDFLVAELSAVLRRGRERIALDVPFATLGLDSLMALELRNRLEAGLGLALPATIVWSCPTVADLADDMAGRLRLEPPLEVDGGVDGGVDGAPPEIPGDGLSEADVDLLDRIAHQLAAGDKGADGVDTG